MVRLPLLLTSVKLTWIKRIKKILNLKNKGQMTIVPLILISSSQTKATTPGSSTGRGCFQDAGLPPGRGSKVRARGGRSAHPRVGVRALGGGGGGALPWLTGDVRL